MRIEFPWNTVLEVKSAEKPDTLVGEGLDGVVMSEAAISLANGRIWQQYIQPSIMDRRGWAIFPSTPRGYNAYEQLWKLGQDSNYPDYQSWRFPSWLNNRVFPGGRNDSEIKTVEANSSPQFFAQEIAAEFTTFVGRIYDEWDETLHVDDIVYNPAWQNYWAIDFGFSSPTVCLDIMVDPSNNVYVWREYAERYRSSYDNARALKERDNPADFHVDAIFPDPRGADEIAVMTPILGRMGTGDEREMVVPWKQGVEAVKRYLKPQEDGIPKLKVDRSCTELIRQMTTLRAPDDTGREKNPREGQRDYDDHGPDALRYFFSQHFVLGLGANRLSDVYDMLPRSSDSGASIFTYNDTISLSDYVGYGSRR